MSEVTADFSTDGLVELETGKPAAGGGCVARLPDGRVAFVRHSLPGERVLARITEESARYVRADAVVIGQASPDRVDAPCRYAGPGKCGGCDYQHAALPAQRQLKAALVAEQLARVARLERAVVVEPVAGDSEGLRWRTRVRYSVLPRGRLGLRKYRSHEIQPVDRCPIAAPAVSEIGLETLCWPGAAEVEAFAPEGGEAIVSVRSLPKVRLEVPRFDAGLVVDGRARREPSQLETTVLGRRFQVSAGAFWQVHAGAPEAIGETVLAFAGDCEGAGAADLYSGVGLLTVMLAEAVGASGHVVAIERDARAVRDAGRNTARFQHVDIVEAAVTADLVRRELRGASLAVLDPPRQGAGVEVMAALISLAPRLQKIVYVSCDAASFARDLRVALDMDWTLGDFRALDLFPMTEHVELVALITPPP
ncbi:MAG TPA: TRAM domain-containing protein [Acidimicrobiales bacterium]|nr:TRAM domain-containing protein [Acidimicrobiales bacterium]